jgi:hypothetical protein
MLRALLIPPLLLLLPSCRGIAVTEQTHLVRPAMQMGERGALGPECGLTGQVERGRASSSNAAGGGCSACH